jgi:hypothetical protein
MRLSEERDRESEGVTKEKEPPIQLPKPNNMIVFNTTTIA